MRSAAAIPRVPRTEAAEVLVGASTDVQHRVSQAGAGCGSALTASAETAMRRTEKRISDIAGWVYEDRVALSEGEK